MEEDLRNSAGDLGLVLGLGRSPGEGKGHPLQYSGLESSMDYTVHGEKYDGRRNIKLKEGLLLPIPFPHLNTHTGKDLASYQEIPAFIGRVGIWRARGSPMQDAGEF